MVPVSSLDLSEVGFQWVTRLFQAQDPVFRKLTSAVNWSWVKDIAILCVTINAANWASVSFAIVFSVVGSATPRFVP